MVCVKCRAQIPDGISFCPKCGAAVVPEKRCPKCGSVVGADMNFCKKCGSPLTDPAPAAGSSAPGGGNNTAGFGSGAPGGGNNTAGFGSGAPGGGNNTAGFGNSAPGFGGAPGTGGVTSPVAKSGFRWWYAAAAVVGVFLLVLLGKAFVDSRAKNPPINVINDPYDSFVNGTWTSEPTGTVTMSRPLDYEVSILSARTSYSLATGHPCIIITYSFTNKSNYDRKFYGTVSWNAYQSDYQVAVVTDPDDPIYDELSSVSKMVPPGETAEIEIAFSVADRTNPVILIELVDNQDKNLWVQKKFTFVPDN